MQINLILLPAPISNQVATWLELIRILIKAVNVVLHNAKQTVT